jgi:hypothetical protein
MSRGIRGFLTAVVRKKLGKVASEKAACERVYRIIGGNSSAESAAERRDQGLFDAAVRPADAHWMRP